MRYSLVHLGEDPKNTPDTRTLRRKLEAGQVPAQKQHQAPQACRVERTASRAREHTQAGDHSVRRQMRGTTYEAEVAGRCPEGHVVRRRTGQRPKIILKTKIVSQGVPRCQVLLI